MFLGLPGLRGRDPHSFHPPFFFGEPDPFPLGFLGGFREKKGIPGKKWKWKVALESTMIDICSRDVCRAGLPWRNVQNSAERMNRQKQNGVIGLGVPLTSTGNVDLSLPLVSYKDVSRLPHKYPALGQNYPRRFPQIDLPTTEIPTLRLPGSKPPQQHGRSGPEGPWHRRQKSSDKQLICQQ